MNDYINGAFELFGAALLLLNIRRILRDRSLAGVSWLPVAFFTAWGVWNVYYYPTLNQWASFVGGVAMVLVNMVWLGCVWRCYFEARRRAEEELLKEMEQIWVDYMKRKK